jgi:hypothetical protein
VVSVNQSVTGIFKRGSAVHAPMGLDDVDSAYHPAWHSEASPHFSTRLLTKDSYFRPHDLFILALWANAG